MNIKNNKRRQKSQEKIEKVFVELMQTKEITEITVSEICKRTELNRSTFYANYLDVYDLADKIKKNLEYDIRKEYEAEWESQTHSHNFLKLFRHIEKNQLFYQTYFKLDYDNTYKSIFYSQEILEKEFGGDYLTYHVEFFRSGLTAVIKKWLSGGCIESPEEMEKILKDEYHGRKL